jgi:redox-sensitive bicupin YhaK (pirin superfamily)
MHGIQSWVGLPMENEEAPPSFQHAGKKDLPTRTIGGATVRIVTGQAYGLASPVKVPMEIFYVDAQLPAGSSIDLPEEYAERGAMVIGSTVEAGGTTHSDGAMILFDKGERATIRANQGDARVMLLGGAPLDGERHVWWNFVSSRRERIEQAKADWKAKRFGLIPGDDKEFIPLPE